MHLENSCNSYDLTQLRRLCYISSRIFFSFHFAHSHTLSVTVKTRTVKMRVPNVQFPNICKKKMKTIVSGQANNKNNYQDNDCRQLKWAQERKYRAISCFINCGKECSFKKMLIIIRIGFWLKKQLKHFQFISQHSHVATCWNPRKV